MEDINLRIGQFVALRDKIKAIEEQHKAQLKPYKDALAALGNVLQSHLLQTKQDSASTASGTAYLTTKATASIADGAAFRRHVIGSQAWELIDWRANSTAAKEYLEANDSPPPGVNLTQVITIGVRRS